MAQTRHNTRGIGVAHKRKSVGERYAPAGMKETPQISWWEGKGITAALVSILVRRAD
jgi:hypothetical protein